MFNDRFVESSKADFDDGAPTALCRVWLWQVVSSGTKARSSHRRWSRVLRSHLAERCIAMALDIDAGSVRLSHNAEGRPVVLEPPPGRALSLSLSDSSSHLAIAVSRTPNLGIDIEALHGRVIALEPLPWIAPSEAAAIAAAPAAVRRRHFLSIWTQKEAYLKALGHGLGTRLADFEVEPHPDAEPAVLRALPGGEVPTIHLRRLSRAGFVGAIASDHPNLHVAITSNDISDMVCHDLAVGGAVARDLKLSP
jgi:phosphopantetheinyl transferase